MQDRVPAQPQQPFQPAEDSPNGNPAASAPVPSPTDPATEHRLRNALLESEAKYLAFVANSSEAIYYVHLANPLPIGFSEDEQVDRILRDGIITQYNQTMARMYDLPAPGQPARYPVENLLSRCSEQVMDFLREFVRSAYQLTDVEMHLCQPEGDELFLGSSLIGIVDTDQLIGAWGVQTNITGERLAELRIKQLSKLVEQCDDAVMVTNRDGAIEYVNRAFEAQTGYTLAEVAGKTPRILKSGKQDPAFYDAMWKEILAGKVHRAPIINRHKNGQLLYEYHTITPLRDDNGEVSQFLATTKDITEIHLAEERLSQLNAELEQRIAARTQELAAANSKLQQLAVEDGLTRLANRRHFDDVLEQEVRRAHRSGEPLSLILGDVDHFKAYNDHYGHPAGDRCLQAVAAAMRQTFRRAGELPARYGGEEFVVILPATAPAAAQAAAQRLREAIVALALPHEYSSAARYVTISIGCATLDTGSHLDAAALLKAADEALYASKHQGRNRVSWKAAA